MIDFALQFLGVVTNPFVFIPPILLCFVARRRATIRAGAALTGAALAMVDVPGTSLAWAAGLIAASALAGLGVGEFVLVLLLPLGLAGITGVRWLMARLGDLFGR